MTQANTLLTITEPQLDVAFFIPENAFDPDIAEISVDLDESDPDDEIPEDLPEKKGKKVTASRRRDPNKK